MSIAGPMSNVKKLVVMLGSGGEEQQARAADKLGNLAYGNAAIQEAIANEGGIGPLVALVRKKGGSTQAQRLAARALDILTANNAANQAAIAREGGREALETLARFGRGDAQQQARRALQSIPTAAATAAAAAAAAAEGAGVGGSGWGGPAPAGGEADQLLRRQLAEERCAREVAERERDTARQALQQAKATPHNALRQTRPGVTATAQLAGARIVLADERRKREAAEARLAVSLAAAQARAQEVEEARQQAQQAQLAQQAAERERDEARQAQQLAEAAARQQAAQAAAATAAQQAQAAAEARAAALEARVQTAEAALCRAAAAAACAPPPPTSLGARILTEFSLRYVGPPHADAAKRSAVLWSLADDGAAPPSSLEAAMVMSLWQRGGRRRGAVRGYELTRIEAAHVDGELKTSFLSQARQLNENCAVRIRGDPDGEKAAVLNQLKEEMLDLKGMPRCGVVLGLHGTSHDNAAKLFRGGFAQNNLDDNGASSPEHIDHLLRSTDTHLRRPFAQATLARACTCRRTPNTHARMRPARHLAPSTRPTRTASSWWWRATWRWA